MRLKYYRQRRRTATILNLCIRISDKTDLFKVCGYKINGEGVFILGVKEMVEAKIQLFFHRIRSGQVFIVMEIYTL